MTGAEYEEFVRAVLIEKLGLAPEELQSAHAQGVTFPGASDLVHQIDLFYMEEREIAKYLTIFECKYRTSRKVDQTLVQNLAFVRDNVRAHKAVMVTNLGFTAGAKAVAESQRIALLVVRPVAVIPDVLGQQEWRGHDIQMIRKVLGQQEWDIQVIQKVFEDPCDDARDLVAGLLSRPEIRSRTLRPLEDLSHLADLFAGFEPDLERRKEDSLRMLAADKFVLRPKLAAFVFDLDPTKGDSLFKLLADKVVLPPKFSAFEPDLEPTIVDSLFKLASDEPDLERRKGDSLPKFTADDPLL